MSEHRKPIASLSTRFAENSGNKNTKLCKQVEVYPAHFFSHKWEPGSKAFYPKLSFQSEKRKEQWNTLYRVRIGGVWYTDKAKYTLLTQDQIIDKWIRW